MDVFKGGGEGLVKGRVNRFVESSEEVKEQSPEDPGQGVWGAEPGIVS